ncbi:flagellar hook-length control protein FliK [Halomonas organivorans]
MSGITPLIDTLLHQVLGKRADVPPAKPLNQPVKPTAPAEAPRAVHSDSRLDARAPGPTSGDVAKGKSPGARPLPVPGNAPPSALTHLSGTARTIGDLLVRFPAPPSVVSPAVPLMTAGSSAAPGLLAQRLEGSIRDSGLFYESHLARWYQGKLPPSQLMREPQMLRTRQFLPLPTSPAQGAVVPGGGQLPSLAARVQALSPPVPFLSPALHPRGEGMPPAALQAATPAAKSPVAPGTPTTSQPPAAPGDGQGSRGALAATRAPVPESPVEGGRLMGRGEPVHESLQSLVRHQLEMLAAPSLRWEGDVWSGLFMALVIQLPQGRRDGRGGGDDEAERGEDEHGGWRSDLELEVAGLGPIKASLWMKEAHLDIDLQIRDEGMLPCLETGLEALRQRLTGHGFEEVRLRLGPMAIEEGS